MPRITDRDGEALAPPWLVGVTGPMTWNDGRPYVDELAKGVYSYIQPDGGWMVNNAGVVVDRSGGSLLVDTLATEARTRALLAQVASLGAGQPGTLVNTHHHPDHTYGNGFLPPETKVISHDLCRVKVIDAGLEAVKVITEPEYGDLVLRPPDVTFSDAMTLHLDSRPVHLRHLGPAHTTNDVVVWLPDEKVLFAGDLAFAGGQPFMLEGSVTGFRAALSSMRDLEPEVLVPGHGPVCRGEEVSALLDALTSYTDLITDVAAEGIAAGRTPLEAAKAHRDHQYATWAEGERFVGNLHRAYAELGGETQHLLLTVPTVWPEMVVFRGEPIHSHA